MVIEHSCWRCAEKPDPVIFSYSEADLLKLAEKYTTYFGMNREGKDTPNMTDRMALTEGESFLSHDFLDDAREKVFEWVQAFARGVENACKVENSHIIYTLQPEAWWDSNAKNRVEDALKNAIVHYVIFRWYEFVKADEAEYFYNKYEDYAHEAQLGMNAERVLIQKPYKTF